MFGRREGRITLTLVVVVGLYLLLALSVVQTVLVLDLYATRSVDATACGSLILAFVSAQVSLIFISTHAFLARRARTALVCRSGRSTLNSVCRFLPRVLIMLWMVTASVGIIVAARQPTCLPGIPTQNFWQVGLSCRLHRAIVAMAVLAFFSTCMVFTSIEVSKQPYHASIFGIIEPVGEDAPGPKPVPSLDSSVREKTVRAACSDLEAANSDRALWLQRRNSLSTQSAIFPPNLRCFSSGPLVSPYQHPRLSTYCPSSTYGPPSRTISFSSTRTPSSSDLSIFCGSTRPTRALSTVSSASRSTSSTSTRRSPLSTMRRVSEPEVPIIPAQFRESQNAKPLQRRPTLPCSWSPTLSHAPLSADPAIRAFSTEMETSPSYRSAMTVGGPQRLLTSNTIRFAASSENLDCNLQSRPATPELPVRARGHSLPSALLLTQTASANAVPATNILPAPTHTSRRRIAATPTHTPAPRLEIPRVRPPLAVIQNVRNNLNSSLIRPPQPVIHNNSSHSNAISANCNIRTAHYHYPTLSTDSTVATQGTLEARLMKKWWKLVRSGQHPATSGSSQGALESRFIREDGRENRRQDEKEDTGSKKKKAKKAASECETVGATKKESGATL